MTKENRRLADSVRAACIEAALAAHEDAGLQGLCPEGRWEAAIDAIRRIDLATVVSEDPESAEETALPAGSPRNR
jgi:hypothetical protein